LILNINRILISRIDAIGDVTLTLPMCGYLKTIFPDCEIYFLGRNYTKGVIESCSAVDHFIDYHSLSILSMKKQISYIRNLSLDACVHVFPNRHLSFLFKKARIPVRIGTTNRLFHWFTCNKLVRLSRKRSNLHEAALNLRLLLPLTARTPPKLNSLYNYYRLDRIVNLPERICRLLDPEKFNIILHPKSHGSGKEWPLSAYKDLIKMLPKDKYQIFISGSEKEKPVLSAWIKSFEMNVIDITGQMNLPELIAFLHQADGLVACSTGPLHLAAASGIHVLGLYPNTPPLHPGRWAPIGKKAGYIESKNSELDSISAMQVYHEVKKWSKN
jgi:heptosyltransferase III